MTSSISPCQNGFEFRQNVRKLVGVVLEDDFKQQTDRAKTVHKDPNKFIALDIPKDDLAKKFPLLTKFHMSLTPHFISTLLGEITKLSELFPEDNILQFQRHDGSVTTCVPIPNAKNADSFTRNVERKKLLKKIPEAIFPCDKVVAAEWLLHEFGKKYEDEFVATAKKIG